MVYLLQYVQETENMDIRFSGSRFDKHVFTDADWAGGVLTRRSSIGYVEFAAAGPLAWGSQLHVCLLSTLVLLHSLHSDLFKILLVSQQLDSP